MLTQAIFLHTHTHPPVLVKKLQCLHYAFTIVVVSRSYDRVPRLVTPLTWRRPAEFCHSSPHTVVTFVFFFLLAVISLRRPIRAPEQLGCDGGQKRSHVHLVLLDHHRVAQFPCLNIKRNNVVCSVSCHFAQHIRRTYLIYMRSPLLNIDRNVL